MWEKGEISMDCTEAYRGNTSCILSMASAKSSYAMPLSAHGATGTGGGKEKYPLNTSQKKSSIL